MKNFSLIIILCILFLSACSQPRNVQKAYAFLQHKTFGTIAVDANGNPLSPGSQTTIFIYIESKGTVPPKINEVVYNGKTYKNPILYSTGKNQREVGSNISNGKPVLLTPARGNSLWNTEIAVNRDNVENERTLPKESSAGIPINTVTIKGIKDGKKFSLTINNINELKPFEGL